MTTMCPMAAAVASPPIMSFSINSVRNPCRAHSSAQAAPTMPPPTISTSYVAFLMLECRCEMDHVDPALIHLPHL